MNQNENNSMDMGDGLFENDNNSNFQDRFSNNKLQLQEYVEAIIPNKK
jgi:hypothetical protein